MDLVYVVRPGENNEELRYSLRTVAVHLEHDRIFIVGHTPSWVAGVESLQTIQAGTKYANSTRNVLTACCTAEVSDPFVLMNDDFFITAPVNQVPALHRGIVIDVLTDYQARYGTRIGKRNHYIDGMAATLQLLNDMGHHDPLSYELHVPLVVHKDAMREAIEVATTAGLEAPHKRTLYGNLAHLGGQQTRDVKVNTSSSVQMPEPFVSTCDKIFRCGWIGRRIRATFNQPSPHEAQQAKV